MRIYFLFVVGSIIYCVQPIDAAELHVAPSGVADASGTSERPLADLEQARDIIRDWQKNGIVRRKDEANFDGDYRTKRVILGIYDAMAEAIRTGQPYQTSLNPPPGPPTDAEGNFIPVANWDQSNWPLHIHPPHAGQPALGGGK